MAEILTESGALLLTESGSILVTEDEPVIFIPPVAIELPVLSGYGTLNLIVGGPAVGRVSGLATAGMLDAAARTMPESGLTVEMPGIGE